MSVDSTYKLLEYINKVAREPIVLDGKPFGVLPPTSIRLNESFFVKDDCKMCGKCCPWETNAWTQEGMNRILKANPEDFLVWGLSFEVVGELETLIREEHHTINGKDVVFYCVPKPKLKEALHVGWPDRDIQPRCRWLFEKDGTYRCQIHPVRSITCGMPHCRFYYSQSTRTTSIGLSQFGRNWKLRCPVEFGIEIDEESIKYRMMWLRRLNAAAQDLGIRTWIPEIEEYMDSRKLKPVVLDNKKKLF